MTAGPGAFVFLPRDVPHGFRIQGDAPARLLLLCSPGGFERFVVEMSEAHHAPMAEVAAKYNIEVKGIQGISTESEAGLQQINSLVDLIVKRKVRAVFVETSVAEKNVRALVEGAAKQSTKVEIGGTLFSDAMGAAGTYEGTYIGMIDHNITIITRALGGEAPEKGMQGKLK